MTAKLAREKLLKQIYAPLHAVSRDFLAHHRIMSSGECWSNWHKPHEIDRFASLQERHRDVLGEIDRLKAVTPMSKAVVMPVVDEYAHQSVQIENNALSLGDSRTIATCLEEKLLHKVSLGTYNTARLKHLDLPTANEILPGKSENDVAELRNHILISRWVALNALQGPNQGTAGLKLSEISNLQVLMLRNTQSEHLYAYGWGPRTQPGDYRQTPIRSNFNPLRVIERLTAV